jgi:hypothetical protein
VSAVAKKRGGLFAKVGLQLVHHQAPAIAGEAAMGLWTFLTLYSRLNELDGFVPLRIAERGWSGDVKANRAHLKTLSIPSVALLISMLHPLLGEGFLVLKYEEFNETKADIADRRARGNARVQKNRNGDVTRYNSVTGGVTNALLPVSDSVSVSSESSSESDARESEAPSGVHLAVRPRDPLAASFLAAAYAEGQVLAGAPAYPPPSSPKHIQAIDQAMVYAQGPNGEPLRGSGGADWLRTTSAAYRKAKSLSAAFERGYGPEKFLEWLGAGRPVDVAKDRYGQPVLTGPQEKRAVTMSEGRSKREEDAFHRSFAADLARRVAK